MWTVLTTPLSDFFWATKGNGQWRSLEGTGWKPAVIEMSVQEFKDRWGAGVLTNQQIQTLFERWGTPDGSDPTPLQRDLKNASVDRDNYFRCLSETGTILGMTGAFHVLSVPEKAKAIMAELKTLRSAATSYPPLLLPCPFCGSYPINTTHGLMCPTQGCTLRTHCTIQEWNRRSP